MALAPEALDGRRESALASGPCGRHAVDALADSSVLGKMPARAVLAYSSIHP